MMRKLLALLLTACTPALATHVNEPTAAVTSAKLLVIHYGSGTIADCSGAVPFAFNNARLEITVTVAGKPSEHFRVTESVVREVPGGNVKVWDSAWAHQNVPPHANGSKWNVNGNTNTYGFEEHPGFWKVSITVTGDESGAVFTDVCRFRVPAA